MNEKMVGSSHVGHGGAVVSLCIPESSSIEGRETIAFITVALLVKYKNELFSC